MSGLPLGYCTNVHPGRSVAEVYRGLSDYAVPVQRRWGGPMGVGLWFAQPVVDEILARPGEVGRLKSWLAERSLHCYTMNAFPYGDFHKDRVKEQVYLPDWSDPLRADYTLRCAEILAELLDLGNEGSISTLPLGFKGFAHGPEFLAACESQLQRVAVELERLHARTGQRIRLAIEPEPFCLLETTAEATEFFTGLYAKSDAAGCGRAVREAIGLCYDVCHQAVEFERPDECVAALHRAGVRINKVQISCAIQLDRPGENEAGRLALANFVEPRYLHQTFCRDAKGVVSRRMDLTRELCVTPPPEFREAECWRTHFHIPVDAESLGVLSTTRPDLRRALRALRTLPYEPHLEIETYTWQVLPTFNPQGGPEQLAEGIARELLATREMLDNDAPGP